MAQTKISNVNLASIANFIVKFANYKQPKQQSTAKCATDALTSSTTTADG